MPKDPETVTWGEVCENVRFGDGLYSKCREKVSDYPAGGRRGFAGGAFDEVPGHDTGPSFEQQLRKTALKVPEPPSAEDLAKYPPGYGEGPEIFGMPLNQVLMYGGAALVLAWLLMRNKMPQATKKEAPDSGRVGGSVTSPKAA